MEAVLAADLEVASAAAVSVVDLEAAASEVVALEAEATVVALEEAAMVVALEAVTEVVTEAAATAAAAMVAAAMEVVFRPTVLVDRLDLPTLVATHTHPVVTDTDGNMTVVNI